MCIRDRGGCTDKLRLAQQPGQKRDKGHADQGNAAADLTDLLLASCGEEVRTNRTLTTLLNKVYKVLIVVLGVMTMAQESGLPVGSIVASAEMCIRDSNWGLGWWREGDNQRCWYFGTQAPSNTIGHQGWTGTLTMIDPVEDLVAVSYTHLPSSILAE